VQYRKRILAIEFTNKGFLVSFGSGDILIRSKKIPAFHFFKTKPLIKFFKITKKLSNISEVPIRSKSPTFTAITPQQALFSGQSD